MEIWIERIYFDLKLKKMEQLKLSVPDQIAIALDGRTQRWLALQIRMPETELSKKMNDKVEFTEDEIKEINSLLKVKIKL